MVASVDDFNKALSYSFLLLKYRDRSSTEIAQRLKNKKYSSSAVKQVLQYLSKNRYIDDEKFVDSYARAALEKGWGPRKTDLRLRQLGISASLRKHVQLYNADFKKNLRALTEDKVRNLRKQKPPLESKNICQKTMRYLLMRGFDYQDVYREVNRLRGGHFEDS